MITPILAADVNMDAPHFMTNQFLLVTLLPAIIGFLIVFVLQFRLRYHVDRDKVLNLNDLSELYSHGLPPKKVLTRHGLLLYRWFCIGMWLFSIGFLAAIVIFAIHSTH